MAFRFGITMLITSLNRQAVSHIVNYALAVLQMHSSRGIPIEMAKENAIDISIRERLHTSFDRVIFS